MSVRNLHSVRPSSASPVAPRPVMQGQGGFSLIEMMIVIAILAVVTVLAAPSITNSLERWRNKELSQSLVLALKEARNEALFRHQNIRVEYNSTGITLEQTVAPSSESAVIRTYNVAKANLISPEADIITFGANKSVSFTNSASSDQAKIQTMCNTDGKVGRLVIVDKVGNISISTENSQC